MDNIQIENMLFQHCITKPYFMGVFSADASPKFNKKKKNIFIFNTSDSNEPGKHWIAILLQNHLDKRKNIYFDSYGFPPKDKRFIKFMKNSYIYNKKPLQHEWSTVCGQWCIYFTFMMSMKKQFNSIFLKFSSDPKQFIKNDYIVNRFVNKMFGTKLKVINKTFIRKKIQKI